MRAPGEPLLRSAVRILNLQGERLNLSLNVLSDTGPGALDFDVTRMVNAGFTGRNSAAVQAHIDELAAEGVAPPPFVPVLYPVVSHNIATADSIQVSGERTSGEAEIVLFLQGTSLHIGVGSDHTDRALEAYGILESKQICLNVCSQDVWSFDRVKDHWDDLVIRSWVTPSPGDGEILYQEGTSGDLLPPEDLIQRITGGAGALPSGLVIFGGTVPVMGGAAVFGSAFRCELADPILESRLSCEYRVTVLDDPNRPASV